VKELTVLKLDEDGNEIWRYPAVELERGDHNVRLEAYFNRDDMDLGFATFARGDRFVETFYDDRWYNVFAVYMGSSDNLKGWYCNVCRPAVLAENEVRCEDLALDLWAAPGAEPLILDEDEFARLSLTPLERTKSLRALQELLNLANEGLLPC
jgi:uncharacterized protein